MKEWVFNDRIDACLNLESGMMLRIVPVHFEHKEPVLLVAERFGNHESWFEIATYPTAAAAREAMCEILGVNLDDNDSLFVKRVYVPSKGART